MGAIGLGLYVNGYNVIIIYERGELTYITEWFSLNGSEGENVWRMEVSEYIIITL